jgi:hypothetical protein
MPILLACGSCAFSAAQEEVFERLGRGVLASALEGFNVRRNQPLRSPLGCQLGPPFTRGACATTGLHLCLRPDWCVVIAEALANPSALQPLSRTWDGSAGSGKSYTMMGTSTNKGLIPRLCEALYAAIDEVSGTSLLRTSPSSLRDATAFMQSQDPNLRFHTEVSYMEIYNEKVRMTKTRPEPAIPQAPVLSPCAWGP